MFSEKSIFNYTSFNYRLLFIAAFFLSFSLQSLSATVYPATPYITPAAGTYSSGQTVSISDSTSGTLIYYTTDGSTPTSSSATYSGTIAIPSGPGSETIRAIAVDAAGASSVATSGYTITPILAVPAFSPAQGSFGSAQSVTISSATPGSVIEYTLDGTQPTASSPIYSTPISVTQKETIKALVTGVSGYAASATVSDTYTIVPATPYITPATGTYTAGQTVKISDSTPGTALYYTTDGTAPSPSSSLYAAPFATTTAQGSQTVRAMAVLGGVYGSTASNTYTISPVLAVPSFSPAGGSFGSAQSVTLSTTSPNGIIYYTLDGTSPTTSSPVYSAPIAVTQKVTMKAFTAGVPGYTASGSSSATYSITPATPYITPVTGTYNASQSVTISDSTPGTTLYYTTDGTAPTPSSAVYTAPLSTPSTAGAETVRALAVLGGVYSSTASTTYTISPVLASSTTPPTAPLRPPVRPFIAARSQFPAPRRVLRPLSGACKAIPKAA
jgi:Chitobiase/beta-hexosaminidase C-terminal domain